MKNNNEQREHKIVGRTSEGIGFVVKAETQDLTFKFDKYTKGRSVALTLCNGIIDCPNIDIYIEHDELVGLLRFLLDDQKKVEININHLIEKVVVVTSSPGASHVEIQKEIVDAITKAISDVAN